MTDTHKLFQAKTEPSSTWIRKEYESMPIKMPFQDSGQVSKPKEMHITAFSTEIDSSKVLRRVLMKKKEGVLSNDMKASLSFLLAIKNNRNLSQSLSLYQQDSMLLDMISIQFDSLFYVDNRRLSTDLVIFNKDTVINNGLLSKPYTDVVSQQNYAVFLTDYPAYLLKKIIPQILFSLLLFCCIVLAFLSIYRNLRQQQRLTALKNDFISNITHELKTPITTVGVAIEALSNFNALHNPKRTQEYLNISKHELQRLSILVDRVLKMSLFEQKEPELKLEPLNLKLLIQDILASFQLQFDKLAAKVDFNTFGSDFNLQADRIHLTSVVYNLLDNALKYSKHQPQIRINLTANPNELKISVQDNGIGIERDYLDKVFDKFFRVPTGNAHNIKGHGLGLSYVASVVNKHQGKIEVESRLGEGSNFIVSFPKQLLN